MPRKPSEHVATDCACLDKLMGGGIPRGQVTLVYGGSNAGKTTLALQCAASASREDQVTLYIDCESSFSPERLAQIASKDLKTVSSRIFVYKLQSFSEQSRLFEDMDRYVSKSVALIVVDTITSLYRLELRNPSLVFSSNRSLNRQLAYLNQTAKASHIAVLMTSQVHNAVREEEAPLVEPVATRVLGFWSQNVLRIRAGSKTSIRRVDLEKHSEPSRVGGYCSIQLDEAGVVDSPSRLL